jgi:hypothetical protein
VFCSDEAEFAELLLDVPVELVAEPAAELVAEFELIVSFMSGDTVAPLLPIVVVKEVLLRFRS